ncbi:hypothetical protein SLS62_010543 [Diatrype stigma]|uniref:Terpene synthase n=1 Tax=Diatrype stigma TaxID=117547 RepID=A0AAN9U925_9PEZI
MCGENEREALAKRLKGQKLVIPNMQPIFANWPGGQNENYPEIKAVFDKEFRTWWPTATKRRYRVLTDFIIWFCVWDDAIEQLGTSDQNHNRGAAERLRAETKAFVKEVLLSPAATAATAAAVAGNKGANHVTAPNPLLISLGSIGEELRTNLDEEQRGALAGYFDKYIDATQLEAEADQGTDIPSLEKYWEVRKLSSGMPLLLGLSEYAHQIKLPIRPVNSTQYRELWDTAIVINSIVNDLISFKKEMKAGSLLSSVAILYHQLDDLDAAVQISLDHLKELVSEFDRTAEAVLRSVPAGSSEFYAVSKDIDSMRTVNTGNLNWSPSAMGSRKG